jgi:hypothetical protein
MSRSFWETVTWLWRTTSRRRRRICAWLDTVGPFLILKPSGRLFAHVSAGRSPSPSFAAVSVSRKLCSSTRSSGRFIGSGSELGGQNASATAAPDLGSDRPGIQLRGGEHARAWSPRLVRLIYRGETRPPGTNVAVGNFPPRAASANAFRFFRQAFASASCRRRVRSSAAYFASSCRRSASVSRRVGFLTHGRSPSFTLVGSSSPVLEPVGIDSLDEDVPDSSRPLSDSSRDGRLKPYPDYGP